MQSASPDTGRRAWRAGPGKAGDKLRSRSPFVAVGFTCSFVRASGQSAGRAQLPADQPGTSQNRRSGHRVRAIRQQPRAGMVRRMNRRLPKIRRRLSFFMILDFRPRVSEGGPNVAGFSHAAARLMRPRGKRPPCHLRLNHRLISSISHSRRASTTSGEALNWSITFHEHFSSPAHRPYFRS